MNHVNENTIRATDGVVVFGSFPKPREFDA